MGLYRVIVFDDDERLAELTARGLRRLGYEAEGRTRVTPLKPREIAILDLGLLPSLEIGERNAMKAARPIVVTGAADPASRALAASVEASDYLVKPVDIEDLAAAIRQRIDST